MDLLYRAFCGIGPMILTAITDIIDSFKHRGAVIPSYLLLLLLSFLALQPSASYGLLWLCSPARAMASCGSAA
jgi:membrane protein DedA with SNARE-associated domain